MAALAIFAALASPADVATPPVPIATCAVIEAAYTAASRSITPVAPTDIMSSFKSPDLHRIVLEYRAKLPLSGQEFDELKSHQHIYDVPGYSPRCAWKAPRKPYRDTEGHLMRVSFSSPVFSLNGRLALLEVSFQEQGFGFGFICIARQSGDAWATACVESWIS